MGVEEIRIENVNGLCSSMSPRHRKLCRGIISGPRCGDVAIVVPSFRSGNGAFVFVALLWAGSFIWQFPLCFELLSVFGWPGEVKLHALETTAVIGFQSSTHCIVIEFSPVNSR